MLTAVRDAGDACMFSAAVEPGAGDHAGQRRRTRWRRMRDVGSHPYPQTMPVIDDVRRIAADLPGSEERETTAGPAWFVRNKAFVWECRAWPSIPAELREIIERELVVGVKVAQPIDADALREMHPDVFLAQTTRWGEPKVAFRMGGIDVEHLEELIIESWRVQAPRYLRRELDARMGFADS